MGNNNIAQQTTIYSIHNDNKFTIVPKNVTIDFGNCKLTFDKEKITVDELFEVYIKLQNYLNTFTGFNL